MSSDDAISFMFCVLFFFSHLEIVQFCIQIGRLFLGKIPTNFTQAKKCFANQIRIAMDLIQYPPNKKQQANGYKTTKIKQARDRQRLQQVTNQSKRFTGAEENMLNIHELSGKSIINQHKMILSKEKKQKTFNRFMNIRKWS